MPLPLVDSSQITLFRNMSNSGKPLFFVLPFLLLTSLIHGITHPLIKSSCATTLYPDICYSTLSATKNLATKKDVIQHTINKTKEIIQANFHTLNKLTATAGVTKRGKIALHDCLQMAAGTLEGLDKVIGDLRSYTTKKSLRKHADDLKTIMSTTITNKETCLDGFSHDVACKRLRDTIVGGQEHVGKMCSNLLAMIVSLTETDMSNEGKLKRSKLKMWPEWLSASDRKLLQSEDVTPNATVATDGSGDYTTVAAAVAAAPSKSKTRYVIKIVAGVYRENVEIPSCKTNLMFIGGGRRTTIITASKSVAGGSTTFNSATVG